MCLDTPVLIKDPRSTFIANELDYFYFTLTCSREWDLMFQYNRVKGFANVKSEEFLA